MPLNASLTNSVSDDKNIVAVLDKLTQVALADFKTGYEENTLLRSLLTDPTFKFAVLLRKYAFDPSKRSYIYTKRTPIICQNLAELRHYIPPSKMSDAQLQNLKWPQKIEEREKIPVDAGYVNDVVKQTSAMLPLVLENVYAALHDIEYKDASSVHTAVEDLLKSSTYDSVCEQLASKFSLPKEVFAQIVLPHVAAHQAKEFLQIAAKDFLAKYPTLQNILVGKDAVAPVSAEHFIRFVDDFSIDANSIPNSKLIAAAAPQSSTDIPSFIANTVFHPTKKVSVICSVVDTFQQHDVDAASDQPFDSVNWFLRPKKDVQVYGPYVVTIKNISDHYENLIPPLALGLLKENDPRSATIKLSIKNVITQEERELTIYFFKTQDNHSPRLKLARDFERFTTFFRHSAATEGHTLVHCKAGHGRTGNIIKTLLLAPSIETILAELTVDSSADLYKKAATSIHDVLQRIRSARLAAVLSSDQFIEAIRRSLLLSRALRDHALKSAIESSTASMQRGLASATQSPSSSREMKASAGSVATPRPFPLSISSPDQSPRILKKSVSTASPTVSPVRVPDLITRLTRDNYVPVQSPTKLPQVTAIASDLTQLTKDDYVSASATPRRY